MTTKPLTRPRAGFLGETMNIKLRDPDEVGSAEYRAIHELLTDAAESPEHALGILNEFRGWAKNLERRICALHDLPPTPNTPQAFVAQVARMTTTDDPQDSVETLNRLIDMARDADASHALHQSYNAAWANASKA